MPDVFGLGFRHHLAVDRVYYARCQSHPLLRRLGALTCSILFELYSLRNLPQLPDLLWPTLPSPLAAIGVSEQRFAYFMTSCASYLQHRDMEEAIGLMSGDLKERARVYLERWRKTGRTLRCASWVAGPWLGHLLESIRHETDEAMSGEMLP